MQTETYTNSNKILNECKYWYNINRIKDHLKLFVVWYNNKRYCDEYQLTSMFITDDTSQPEISLLKARAVWNIV